MSLRVREKRSDDWLMPIPTTYQLCSPPLTVPHEWYPSMAGPLGGSSYSCICDVTDGIRYAFNPCYHEKYRSRTMGAATPVVRYGPDTVVSFDNGNFLVIDAIRSAVSSALTSAMLDDFSAQAELSFIAPLPEGMSPINAIIELIQMLEGNIKVIKGFIDHWKISIRAFFRELKRVAKGTVPTAGEMWVAWRFAIRPTLKDAKKIFTSIQDAIRALRWLAKVNHRTVRRHYKSGFYLDLGDIECQDFTFGKVYGTWGQVGPPPTYTHVPPMAGEPIEGSLHLRKTEVTGKLFATADVRFNVDDAYVDNGWLSVMTAWSSMQWLYNPWAITWEAVPYSWALDWCLSEKAKLERWKQFHETGDPYALGIIQQACWSVKVILTAEVWYVPLDGEEQFCSHIRYMLYNRELGLPDAGSFWLRSPFDGYKISIGIGILEGRHRRR